jgi:hypothetical protein
MADKDFKAEMGLAVESMIGEQPADIQYGLDLDN